ncbi:dehydrogenase/reductase SDR family member 7C-B isoform X2 [Oryzias melastigma]|nr:dehydrogenase/reductase SDR family member 7C-B isoform X2 [Oryzias melastigma]
MSLLLSNLKKRGPNGSVRLSGRWMLQTKLIKARRWSRWKLLLFQACHPGHSMLTTWVENNQLSCAAIKRAQIPEYCCGGSTCCPAGGALLSAQLRTRLKSNLQKLERIQHLQILQQDMNLSWATTVLLVPCVVVLTAGVFYLYGAVLALLSKTSVRNKVVIITDALSELGKECAGVFHRGGARLVLCGKSWEKLEELSDELASASDPTLTFPPKLVLLDFGDVDGTAEAVSEVLECFGCLDILIFNSSMKVKAPAQTLTLETDKLLMDNNYFGPITLAKGVLPSMISRRSGHLILVNSIQGKLAVPFRTAYAASKHAVQAFFDCLRAEVEEYGISVSTINHTFISRSASQTKPPKSFMSLLFTKKPLGVSPDEATAEIIKTLSNKKKEILMAPSLPKLAVYARCFFPGVFFSVMAAGVNDSAAPEQN